MVTFHLGFLLFSVLVILFADKQALAWFTGKKETLSRVTLKSIHYMMWIGLLGMISTGVIMAYPYITFLITKPIFVAKMLFVGILITNALLIDSLMKVTHEKSFASLSNSDRLPLFISGAVSMCAWVGAATLGFLLF